MPNHPPAASILKDPVTWLYPPIEPYNTGRLQVSPVHEIYFEECGNPAGSDPKQRRFFHPEKFTMRYFSGWKKRRCFGSEPPPGPPCRKITG